MRPLLTSAIIGRSTAKISNAQPRAVTFEALKDRRFNRITGGTAAKIPPDALIEFHLRLRLGEEIVVRIDLDRSVVPCGWVSCVRAANDQTWMVWAGTQAEQGELRRSSERPNRGRFGLVPKRSRKAQRWGAAQGRAGEVAGGRVGSPMCSRIPRTDGVSVTKAILFISAPQYGQVSGKTSNRRAMKGEEKGST